MFTKALLGFCLLTGCTSIDASSQVKGWPDLKVSEHYVSNKAMRDRCAKYVSFFMSPEACAEWSFKEGTCDIYYSKDFPPSRDIVEHERAHCMGYRHVGESE